MSRSGLCEGEEESRSLQVACGVLFFFSFIMPSVFICFIASLLLLPFSAVLHLSCITSLSNFLCSFVQSKASTAACSVSHVNSGKRTGMSWKSKRVSRMQFTRQISVSIRPVSSNLHVLCGELICSVSSAFSSLLVWYHAFVSVAPLSLHETFLLVGVFFSCAARTTISQWSCIEFRNIAL